MKKLIRIRNQESSVAGVALGLAHYYQWDVALVRAAFVVLFFTPFPAGLLYLILWAALPESASSSAMYLPSSNQSVINQTMKNENNSNLVGGVILIILGVIFSFRTFFDIHLLHYIGKMWPLLLIGLGVWFIVRERPTNDPPSNYPPPPANPYDTPKDMY